METLGETKECHKSLGVAFVSFAEEYLILSKKSERTHAQGNSLPSHPALALGRVRHGLAKQGIHLPSDNTPSDGDLRSLKSIRRVHLAAYVTAWINSAT